MKSGKFSWDFIQGISALKGKKSKLPEVHFLPQGEKHIILQTYTHTYRKSTKIDKPQ